MLDNLTQRLAKVVKTMRGEARLTEANTAEMLREVRLALLEGRLPARELRRADPKSLYAVRIDGPAMPTIDPVADRQAAQHRRDDARDHGERGLPAEPGDLLVPDGARSVGEAPGVHDGERLGEFRGDGPDVGDGVSCHARRRRRRRSG